MSKHPVNNFSMTLRDPLQLINECLGDIKPFLITERGRKLEEKLLGTKHLLEAPEDCIDCHYEGIASVVVPEMFDKAFWEDF